MMRTSGQRPSSEGQPKAAARQRILHAAEAIFAERGYGDTRMQDIAASAKVSLRTVYSVAPGKAEIFRNLHRERAADLLSRMEDVLVDELGDPAEILMKVIDVVVAFLMAHPGFLRIQLQEGRAWALADAEHALIDARHASDSLLERLFRRGIRARTFHDEDPKMMVASLRALEQVHLAAWVARRGRVSKRTTTEAIQRAAGRLFCR